jgi:hypothetical protein
MHITQKLILATVAILVTGTAMARDPGNLGSRNSELVAESTPDERAWFRDHWREMSPEQQDAIRNRLRQNWQAVPPEDRQQRRQELIDRMRERNQAPPSGQGHGQERRPRDEGYGQGYGTRS